MSRSSRRAGRQHGRQITQAADKGTLGRAPSRSRKSDRPAGGGTDEVSSTGRGSPPKDRIGTAEWSAVIARILAEADGDSVDRETLRAAMPDLGQVPRTGTTRHERGARGSGGKRGTAMLADVIKRWERGGLVRRDGDSVIVLNRAGLLDWVASTADDGGVR